jgi:hypothetical protein
VTEEENFEALNNDEREPVTEDFEDSPFADRLAEFLEDEEDVGLEQKGEVKGDDEVVPQNNNATS